jgi:hypothetical protein
MPSFPLGIVIALRMLCAKPLHAVPLRARRGAVHLAPRFDEDAPAACTPADMQAIPGPPHCILRSREEQVAKGAFTVALYHAPTSALYTEPDRTLKDPPFARPQAIPFCDVSHSRAPAHAACYGAITEIAGSE